MLTDLALTGCSNRVSFDRLKITYLALTGYGSRLSSDRLIITDLALKEAKVTHIALTGSVLALKS